MAWRGLHLTTPARLSLADGQMVVARDTGTVRLAVEDVAWVVIDTPQATLTTSLIAACMDAGVPIVVTDERHTPSGLLLPFHRHHRQSYVAELQVSATAPLRKRLWQAVVQAKIGNQAAVLEHEGLVADPLPTMAALVGSGDPDNVEARAAREYWRRLFRDFVRENAGDRRNGLLNYGYAVMRAAVARGLVAAGLLPALGIHHASDANAFNLADDLIEPFRPFVDRLVARLTRDCADPASPVTLDERQRLAALPLQECVLGEGTVTLLVAAEQSAASLVRALEAKTAVVLRLPRFAP